MAAAFSSDGKDVILRKLSLELNKDLASDETLEEVYELSRCSIWINENGFQKVALQFPDDLLVDAPDVARSLEKSVPAECYILGDTSYGSCCVDEIAAEHVAAQAVIHFGPACLSQNQRLPVLYIFTTLPFHPDEATLHFRQQFPNLDSHILIFFDVRYNYAIKDWVESINKDYPHLVISSLNIPLHNDVTVESISGRIFALLPDTKLDQYTVFYVGEEGSMLTNLMMTLNHCPFVTYCPKLQVCRQETFNVNKALMKRFYLMEKTKDANIIGILVGTLGVANYLQIMDRLKTLIKNAGKKCYTFAVGKLNPAKLANFPEVDVYVLIACPENSLLDSRDFYRPVITPFELEVALNSDQTWTGDFTTDFRQLLPGAARHVEFSTSTQEIDVSLISGRIRHMGVAEGEEATDTAATGSNAVLPRSTSTALANLHIGGGGEFLSQRTWQGLEPQLGLTPVSAPVPGTRGIAAGYDHEVCGERGRPDGQES